MKRKNLLTLIPLLLLVGCKGKNTPEDTNIVVGCSPTPHSLILEQAKPFVEAQGYTLTIQIFNDYVTPNLSLDSGDLDANYFQHEPYLNDFNANNNTNLVSVGKIHFEPMGIYSNKYTDLRNGCTIAVPNDLSNYNRALDLLTAKGINGTIIQAEAQSLPALLSDVDYAVINGNYALSADITNKCICTEDSSSDVALTNANIIAVKYENRNYPFVNVLLNALRNETIKTYIQTTFGSSVKEMF